MALKHDTPPTELFGSEGSAGQAGLIDISVVCHSMHDIMRVFLLVGLQDLADIFVDVVRGLNLTCESKPCFSAAWVKLEGSPPRQGR